MRTVRVEQLLLSCHWVREDEDAPFLTPVQCQQTVLHIGKGGHREEKGQRAGGGREWDLLHTSKGCLQSMLSSLKYLLGEKPSSPGMVPFCEGKNLTNICIFAYCQVERRLLLVANATALRKGIWLVIRNGKNVHCRHRTSLGLLQICGAWGFFLFF